MIKRKNVFPLPLNPSLFQKRKGYLLVYHTDKAAVVAELARNIGFNLLQEKKVPCSDASVLCLFAANPYHAKPDWFVENFSELIKTQLKPAQITELIKKLGE